MAAFCWLTLSRMKIDCESINIFFLLQKKNMFVLLIDFPIDFIDERANQFALAYLKCSMVRFIA